MPAPDLRVIGLLRLPGFAEPQQTATRTMNGSIREQTTARSRGTAHRDVLPKNVASSPRAVAETCANQ